MERKQRLRVCLNLLQMADTAQAHSARQMYRRQYEQLKGRLRRDKR
ncbi:hypothetical protein M5X00_28390 [Paenibacillus alvei]|nr:hypothetical protein [Paenibacillus alvei]EJW19935.1 hypothetical protein PAV_1c09230 [Paenibacillus alvei DSM 29]MCY9543914.1 hypothetical protein [Paenibacillus alvei]MCY9705574.1 hypothetical protein [Paenibacillus alvei]MCY9738364.1 hypothetical protein [Paenibacillus alvei]MCY9758147.1 hypothetical protein [Paenibacillus alvei]